MITLIAALLISQQKPIPSTTVPPAAEDRVIFSHSGHTYFVGKITGNVFVLDEGGGPEPPPVPVPDDAAPRPISGAKWMTLVVDEGNAEQQSWRTSPDIRKLLELRGIQFRSYTAGEADIDRLGFQQTVGQTGTPTAILQDQAGRVVKSASPKTKDELLKLLGAIK
ncbi:hypothetical protein UFOVP184_46 [uncultured Caudovirales phage]|uniref:Uncharacterized protein n=1 Tax=uncultured Caudovirales phage TaxID=2100421 RepID=A0A6J7WG43_9CAUD|nr:hypothetical protein UFOVP184_46 [uncultured Caudovirales phage]